MSSPPIIKTISPETYTRHFIHNDERIWPETNCYVDVLIELIHALGHDPVAGLAFTLSADFECDQWTFFKYSLADMLELYGMDVQELNPWVSLAEHVHMQVNAGRPVLVELDSFYLPDTQGSAYQIAHVKSTVAVNAIDIKNRTMDYFHGQGYYRVDGENFSNIFQLDGLVHPRMLPPYIEFIKLRPNAKALSEPEKLEKSLNTFIRQVTLLPSVNPFVAFREKFKDDFQELLKRGMEYFHLYSFATLRQYGACFELAADYLKWLDDRADNHKALSSVGPEIHSAKTHFLAISQTAKAYQFQLARAVMRNKPLDTATIDAMAESWQSAAMNLVEIKDALLREKS